MAQSRGDWHNPAPFWENGPAPGAFYNFPGSSSSAGISGMQRTYSPTTTGTSVIGVQFKDGVAIAADTLTSYGSLARFRNCERIFKVNDKIVVGAGGDYADFQYIKRSIDGKIMDEECLDDGFSLKPKSLHCWLTRSMYSMRSSYTPLWNNFIIAGVGDDQVFLGTIDKLGTAYTDPVIATGYGAYMATPLLRKAYDENPEMTKEQAIELLYKAMQVLYYRDARSFPKYYLGIVTKEKGVEIEGPLSLESNWEAALLGRKYS